MNLDIDTDSTGLELSKDAMFRLADTAGIRIAVNSGAVWLTLDNDLRDIVLQPGQSFTDDRHRRGLVFALKPSNVALTSAA